MRRGSGGTPLVCVIPDDILAVKGNGGALQQINAMTMCSAADERARPDTFSMEMFRKRQGWRGRRGRRRESRSRIHTLALNVLTV